MVNSNGVAGPDSTQEPTLLFFDGVCNLCNATVDFLIRADRRGRLRYGSLQGRTAAELLPTLPGGNGLASPDGSDPGTLVLVRGGRVFTRSSAALRALALTGGANRVFALFLVIPRPLRDAVYSWVARHRYRWFGRRETCRLPTQSEKSLFLP